MDMVVNPFLLKNHVPWNFDNLLNDTCSICTPEVSSKESEDAADDDYLLTGTQDTQNISG